MNKRVFELMKECEFYTNGGEVSEVDYEKFAELIVRECIEMAVSEQNRYRSLSLDYSALAIENFEDLLKLHFGVKE